ncbi:p21-activated protein kinase-interacting protein 1-like [Cryptotermes secundus]|uniref:p21-activated protein kinase-interacting protein 1-like n=1 Tax=Cryptotermes secundus TaxID=105785 RepID=UPI000CD7CFE2|nr:p21-activated protein kinase-interacting protein 1-like [Cryptotermes secundus]
MFVPDVEIIVGTYEEFLLGYKTIKKEDAKCYLVQSFADHSHRASIRSVCANGKFLASGSADETIHVYDMNARKESGILVHHIGTVNCLSFSPNGSHLLSGGEDGSIAIFRTGSWQLEKVFAEAHKGEAVTLLSVHPSGKLALSVGTDATLRTWNLVKGRQAYATNLGKNRTGKGRAVSCLLWSPDGSMYVIAVGTEVSVYDVHTAGIMHTFQLAKKVTCICFSQVTQLVVGDEGGGLSVHSISDREQLNTFDAHKHRVKSVSFISIKDKHFLASASSSGQIKLWNCKGGKLREICHTNSDCRITCLLMLEAPQSRQLNQKHIKEECMQTHSTDISAGSETRVRSKRLRKDGGDSHLASRTLDDKAVNRNSELSPTACSFNVICTRGQKWLVEEL